MTGDGEARRERLYNAIGQALAMLDPKEDPEPKLEEIRAHFQSPCYFVEAARPLMARVGVTGTDAFYFSMIPALARRARRDRFGARAVLNSMDLMGEYVRTLYIGTHVERFYLILLDSRGHLVNTIMLQEGTSSSAPFYLKQVLASALEETGARAMVLCHNHPAGTPWASDEDVACTLRALMAVSSVGLPLLDHMIVADRTVVSVRATGRISAELWLMQDPTSALLRNWTQKGPGTQI